jgi:hypothetical protein
LYFEDTLEWDLRHGLSKASSLSFMIHCQGTDSAGLRFSRVLDKSDKNIKYIYQNLLLLRVELWNFDVSLLKRLWERKRKLATKESKQNKV